ncbi:AraC family transcriptional regulator [Paenibacillus rhizophilus]|uniref:AraC family transcriptional regulator n=1 Tax=Paenibacillus rhizophilus TaxID=1850366 RepID=A0A3N9P2M6_9BACL|nr:AraC family ligand binding domain-containing protein [Paenibacillus rhizophilus]RQW09334.1 AraC family transcriptional regulator [Paenibacillus rhizophilus]
MLLNFSNSSRNNLDLNLYTCGREACINKYSYGPAIRSGYIIHYILKGKGIFKVHDKIYHLGKNEAFLIEPNILIYYEADADDPWEYTWVGFQGIKAKEYLNRTSLSTDNPVFSPYDDKRLASCIEHLIAASKNNSNRDLLLNSKLYEFLYLLCEMYPNREVNIAERQQKYIEEAMLFIEQNYSHNITIHEVAKYISIDRSYLHRLFKHYLNKSPQEFLLNIRMEKACQLLRDSSLKIGDIARSVGYNDVLLFSKTFKKMKDCTPSEYKKGTARASEN